MPNIIFNGTSVAIPDSGSAPNWSPAIIEAFQLISQALSISAGPFDIPPQIYTMIANVNTNVDIPNLSFPTSNVTGATIFYAVSRTTTGSGATHLTETGNILLNYDSGAGSGLKWSVSPEFTNSGAQITFGCSDVGQVNFSTTSITGSSHTGSISFRALAVLNNS